MLYEETTSSRGFSEEAGIRSDGERSGQHAVPVVDRLIKLPSDAEMRGRPVSAADVATPYRRLGRDECVTAYVISAWRSYVHTQSAYMYIRAVRTVQ